jgi:N-acetylglucosaminyl-diphospho-decaprenol L-rhamnosyltransferase
MPVPSIDVIIVTRSGELVLSCLQHLAAQTVAHRVHVADNGGDANGAAGAIRACFPEARVVVNETNLGFGPAVDRLAATAGGEVIVLVNDDMEVEPRFLEELVAPLAESEVGMVAGLTLQPASDEVVDGFGIEVDPTLMPFNRLRHGHSGGQPGRLLGPSGAAAAYRRTAWESAGGFDSRFFAYSEDLDLALRLRLLGWRAAAAPRARGVHLGGATAGEDSPLQRRLAGFGRGFILRRYGIMRTRHAPRALLVEALTVLYGLVSARTVVPLTARVAGWRAAGHTERLPVPTGVVDETITLRETLRRVRHTR